MRSLLKTGDQCIKKNSGHAPDFKYPIFVEYMRSWIVWCYMEIFTPQQASTIEYREPNMHVVDMRGIAGIVPSWGKCEAGRHGAFCTNSF